MDFDNNDDEENEEDEEEFNCFSDYCPMNFRGYGNPRRKNYYSNNGFKGFGFNRGYEQMRGPRGHGLWSHGQRFGDLRGEYPPSPPEGEYRPTPPHGRYGRPPPPPHGRYPPPPPLGRYDPLPTPHTTPSR